MRKSFDGERGYGVGWGSRGRNRSRSILLLSLSPSLSLFLSLPHSLFPPSIGYYGMMARRRLSAVCCAVERKIVRPCTMSSICMDAHKRLPRRMLWYRISFASDATWRIKAWLSAGRHMRGWRDRIGPEFYNPLKMARIMRCNKYVSIRNSQIW